jgi:hypothetical protein
MKPTQKSVAVESVMVLVGLGLVLIALLMVLPVAVNLPDSWFGAMLAFVVMMAGISCTYYGGQRLWLKPQ